MKKNVMMRLASGLLIAVLLTTCAIAGTFAKYTTSADAQDSARVAKFGVQIAVSNDNLLFSESYTSANGLTVETSSAGQDLVAPGTSSTENSGTTTITISGTPEVAVNISAIIDTASDKDVFLKAGTYKDWTTEAVDDTFVLADDYYPVKWTLKKTVGGVVTTLVDKQKLSDVIDAFDSYSTANSNVAPNTNIGATFTLEWEWAFDENDLADTLLGQIAAGVETSVASSNYCTEIGYKLDISVTQID